MILQMIFIFLLIASVVAGGIVVVALKRRGHQQQSAVMMSWAILALILSGHAARLYGVEPYAWWAWVTLTGLVGLIIYHARNFGFLQKCRT